MNIDERGYTKVLEYIREEISSGQLKQGSRLPTERNMAQQLQISRPSVREALLSLENMGFIESRQGSGNYLRANMQKSIARSLELMILLQENTKEDIRQLRAALELYAFETAMNHITKEQLKHMQKLLTKMKEVDIETEIHLDRQFHLAIIEASGNQLMIQLMDALSEVCENHIRSVIENEDITQRKRLMDLHEEIIVSLTKKDPARGIHAIREHYREVY